MNTIPLRRLVSVLCLLLAGANWAYAYSSKTAPVPLGGDTYRITREANTPFARATAPLRYEAEGDAAKFCAEQGRRMKVVSVDEEKASIVRGGLSKVTLVFKALAPGDPELADDPLGGEPVAVNTMAERAVRHLRMLEELRDNGVLTEKEYKAATKRVKRE